MNKCNFILLFLEIFPSEYLYISAVLIYYFLKIWCNNRKIKGIPDKIYRNTERSRNNRFLRYK